MHLQHPLLPLQLHQVQVALRLFPQRQWSHAKMPGPISASQVESPVHTELASHPSSVTGQRSSSQCLSRHRCPERRSSGMTSQTSVAGSQPMGLLRARHAHVLCCFVHRLLAGVTSLRPDVPAPEQVMRLLSAVLRFEGCKGGPLLSSHHNMQPFGHVRSFDPKDAPLA